MPQPILKGVIRIDRRNLDKAIREYAKISHRDLKTIVNTKAFYIARRAVIETPAVKVSEIKKFIRSDSGAIVGKTVNKRRGERGDKGLYGEAMAKEVAMILAARLRSRAFLKSGWLWAIKKLEPYAEKIGGGGIRGGAKMYGQAKGNAFPAMDGYKPSAKILNTVTAAWDKREGAAKVAVPALQRAFDAEARSTLAYVQKKLAAMARQAGIRCTG